MEVVGEIVRMRELSYALRRIADALNEREVPTRQRRAWHAKTVMAILDRFAPDIAAPEHTIPQRDAPPPVADQKWAPNHFREQQRQSKHRQRRAT
jgi:Recombinase